MPYEHDDSMMTVVLLYLPHLCLSCDCVLQFLMGGLLTGQSLLQIKFVLPVRRSLLHECLLACLLTLISTSNT